MPAGTPPEACRRITTSRESHRQRSPRRAQHGPTSSAGTGVRNSTRWPRRAAYPFSILDDTSQEGGVVAGNEKSDPRLALSGHRGRPAAALLRSKRSPKFSSNCSPVLNHLGETEVGDLDPSFARDQKVLPRPRSRRDNTASSRVKRGRRPLRIKWWPRVPSLHVPSTTTSRWRGRSRARLMSYFNGHPGTGTRGCSGDTVPAIQPHELRAAQEAPNLEEPGI